MIVVHPAIYRGNQVGHPGGGSLKAFQRHQFHRRGQSRDANPVSRCGGNQAADHRPVSDGICRIPPARVALRHGVVCALQYPRSGKIGVGGDDAGINHADPDTLPGQTSFPAAVHAQGLIIPLGSVGDVLVIWQVAQGYDIVRFNIFRYAGFEQTLRR